MPLVTGVWELLSQIDGEMGIHFSGDALVLDPFTRVSTGKTARQIVNEQAASFGWPLVGMYISASGSIQHFCVHRSQFPVQTGSPSQRAEKLQNDLIAALERIYKTSLFIDDPTDPDFGKTVDVRNFWTVARVWNYRSDGLYVPRISGIGDYAFRVSDSTPPANWWTERG